MIKVVCNTSPIIGLSVINKLNLLWEIFGEVIIPQAVYDDITGSSKNHLYGYHELNQAVHSNHIKVYKVVNETLVSELYGKLHKGELETIVAAKELKISDVIIDEKAARNFAEAMMLQTTGIIGILMIAKRRNKITEIKRYLEILIDHGYRISRELYCSVLNKCGEADV